MRRWLTLTVPLASLAALLLVGSGCVERILQVRSDPPGAAVYVNGARAGETPLDHRFTFYGTVDVAVRAPGHLSHTEVKTLPSPWYQLFPIDVVSELLVPWTISDVHTVEVTLARAPAELDDAGRSELRARAEEMRALLPPERKGSPVP